MVLKFQLGYCILLVVMDLLDHVLDVILIVLCLGHFKA